ncbi:aconitate hydratase AcnA [Rickettsia endosymbiont of Cardiosporidium cionae]|uniref:aconitate hydratase AcnA n=1 Tax=Rickettsia endosymbiont of Cardiosporidium cionae TaxID=2777155 RepID=UPI0018958B03|nr:aconitate hydratase AcnA [Rickettsia endosymbiont of Cardiosporidium cionae]KAF8818700.1 aconitate hydratase AcnA [Rickettsia endosymbiont of Cardiosporidium cionae]
MDKFCSNKYKKNIQISGKDYVIYDINQAASDAGFSILKLPYSFRVLFENIVRNSTDISRLHVFRDWIKNRSSNQEIEYRPIRVLMQDFTGVPAIVDLASMREAMQKLGGDPDIINPVVPVDLVIDHSVQVDSYASIKSFDINTQNEFKRNSERYEFLRWGQKNFKNFRVVPPGAGICHQVNLEYLAKTIWVDNDDKKTLYPDTLVGTDSHTTMVNGLSVLGWGVGGIEAEAVMLGQPLPMVLPEVLGVKLIGKLQQHVIATDLVLSITNILRNYKVVGKFVEFFGPGVGTLTAADRATISNMSPEYGATCGFFPIDQETIQYLDSTARDKVDIEIVVEYSKLQNLWLSDSVEALYTDIIEIDLSNVDIVAAGPTRPQDLVPLNNIKQNFDAFLTQITKQSNNLQNIECKIENDDHSISDGSVVIAAITSCTNTSNPAAMIAAGLVAKKAVSLGLTTKPWVKTSFAPGSRVVTDYLSKSGLNKFLDLLGFNLVGYGCTTCIGNSGPLNSSISKLITEQQLVVASVLSGNRNFEGRIHPLVRANYLMSPPLVVIYALAGKIINLLDEPIAMTEEGHNVFLSDLWPDKGDIDLYIAKYITSSMFKTKYDKIFDGDDCWNNATVQRSSLYPWDISSNYIANPPYFDSASSTSQLCDINQAKILALFGDSVTTDHISPAGTISPGTPASDYLLNHNIDAKAFNSYGSRRGNHHVMVRGTFANLRIKNQLCKNIDGGMTVNHFTKEITSIYDAAMDYKSRNIDLIIFAGKEYGTGSSRDWAAKGTKLLGVRAVVAESFERIHRSNLIGMGVLPIQFKDNVKWQDLKLLGEEDISIMNLNSNIKPYHEALCVISHNNKKLLQLPVVLQIYTEIEVEYLKHGSVLGFVLNTIFSGGYRA